MFVYLASLRAQIKIVSSLQEGRLHFSKLQVTQKDKEAQVVDVRNPKHAWEMLAAANTKIKISRLHSVCVATQDHCCFTETDCVNITALNISF